MLIYCDYLNADINEIFTSSELVLVDFVVDLLDWVEQDAERLRVGFHLRLLDVQLAPDHLVQVVVSLQFPLVVLHGLLPVLLFLQSLLLFGVVHLEFLQIQLFLLVKLLQILVLHIEVLRRDD